MNAADVDTKARHERIWQQFLEHPKVWVYEPSIFGVTGAVAMLHFQAPVADASVRQRLRGVVDGLGQIPCLEPYSDDYLHMTIVPPAFLTREEARPPTFLPDGFEKVALEGARRALRGYGPFQVRIEGLNIFRDVLVAIPLDGGHLAELRQRLIEAVPDLPDRYAGGVVPVPHISLAFYKSAEGVAQLTEAVSRLRSAHLGTFTVTHVQLVKTPLREGVLGQAEKHQIPLAG